VPQAAESKIGKTVRSGVAVQNLYLRVAVNVTCKRWLPLVCPQMGKGNAAPEVHDPAVAVFGMWLWQEAPDRPYTKIGPELAEDNVWHCNVHFTQRPK